MELEKKIYSLWQISKSIEKTLMSKANKTFWVKAEMNKLSYYSHSGHAYPELVEKRDNTVIAQFRGIIWKNDFIRINKNFETILNEKLKDGIKILFLTKLNYDAIHGINLQILDIDPHYTLGDLEKEKANSIKKLKQDNLFYLNKQLQIPLLPQKIAIISVKTSKGYADFMKIVEKYQYKYKIDCSLYPSILQGDKALIGIMSQLETIKNEVNKYDLVMIIRGGGGDIGLSCYNDFELSKQVATFPIPIWSGIGHATNETVVELVANYNAITPTQLAEHLFDRYKLFEQNIIDINNKINNKSIQIINNEKKIFENKIQFFKQSLNHIFINKKNELKNFNDTIYKSSYLFIKNNQINLSLQKNNLLKYLKNLISSKKENIKYLEKTIELSDPKKILEKGFSITYFKSKIIKSTEDLNENEEIITELYNGKITSKISKIN